MKKLITALLITTLLIVSNAFAETIKIDRACWRNNNSIYVHVPIKLQYKSPSVSYNKLLHISCRDDFCGAVTMDTDYGKKGFGILNLTIIENLKRTVNKQDYFVFEWGINVVTVDLINKKVGWIETGIGNAATGSGEATCN